MHADYRRLQQVLGIDPWSLVLVDRRRLPTS
jgi:hypothetical protein